MDGDDYFVRIDTGYGPPGDALRPIELHVAGPDGTLRLSPSEAEALATQLRTAAQAVRVLTGKPSPVSLPTVVPAVIRGGVPIAAATCRKCGAACAAGSFCKAMGCPLNPNAKPADAPVPLRAPSFDQRREDEAAEGAFLAARYRVGSTA